jgi:hypothetical protein
LARLAGPLALALARRQPGAASRLPAQARASLVGSLESDWTAGALKRGQQQPGAWESSPPVSGLTLREQGAWACWRQALLRRDAPEHSPAPRKDGPRLVPPGLYRAA